MIHLTLGRIELDWGKNGGFQNHSALFRPGDLTDIPYFYAADEDDAESAALPLIRHSDTFSYRLITEMKEGYSAPLRTVARRLLLLGHTDDYCREEFGSRSLVRSRRYFCRGDARVSSASHRRYLPRVDDREARRCLEPRKWFAFD
ncbi:HEPN/Toprim-associated domain-containing protein [Rhizobium sullae]|uniref:HEPN/Toprim-associated domain-containing protein n=1 Tax=Rhizobium sullae TaxID=50338 RepID=UPI000B356833